METITPKIKQAYGGTSALIDALIVRFERLETDVATWREQIEMDGLVFHLAGGAVQAHPLLDRTLKAEWSMVVSLREIGKAIRAEKGEEELDEFDQFLQRLENSNKPHQTRNRGQ